MGAKLEINDTLQITKEQGFPVDTLDFQKHLQKPIDTETLGGQIFSFKDKPGMRFYQHAPVRVYLVHNIDGKWLFWARILILSQKITGETDETYLTSGTYKITDVYEPKYQETFTRRESPEGLSFFQ